MFVLISNGKVHHQADFEELPTSATRIDLAAFPSGLYFIAVPAEGRRLITN